jgi:predicted RNase H-like nuclease
MIEPFHLGRIVKYKRGRVDEKRAGLAELTDLMQRRLPQLDPPLRSSATSTTLFRTDPAELQGRALKGYEDCLNVLFCAYLAAHCWAWGTERNFTLGDGDHGSITLPLEARGPARRTR